MLQAKNTNCLCGISSGGERHNGNIQDRNGIRNHSNGFRLPFISQAPKLNTLTDKQETLPSINKKILHSNTLWRFNILFNILYMTLQLMNYLRYWNGFHDTYFHAKRHYFVWANNPWSMKPNSITNLYMHMLFIYISLAILISDCQIFVSYGRSNGSKLLSGLSRPSGAGLEIVYLKVSCMR